MSPTRLTDDGEVLARAVYRWHRSREQAGLHTQIESEQAAHMLGWTPIRLNRAMNALDGAGWLEVDPRQGSTPFDAHGFELSGVGIAECEQLGFGEADGLQDGATTDPDTSGSAVKDHDNSFDDEQQLARAARQLFLEHFARPYKERGYVPLVGPMRGTEQQRARALLPHEYLVRRGLTERSTNSRRVFRISDRGKEIAFREHELDQVLGLAPAPVRPEAARTVNVFQGPVGAVATAPGASAHGTVNVQPVDDALRKVIELQDELGALADGLIPLLRTARKLQKRGASEAELVAAIQDAEEFRAFEKMVKPGLADASVAAAKTVLKFVPLLKPALELLEE